jgi:hypothetical protein
LVGDRRADLQRLDQARFPENGEMRRHGWLRHREVFCQFPGRHRPLAQQFQHLAARRIGEGFEYIAHCRYLAKHRNISQAVFR